MRHTLATQLRNGKPLYAYSDGTKVMTYTSCEDQIANAFYRRKWLVELIFSRSKYVLAVNDLEARTPNEAINIAYRRAKSAIYDTRLYSRDLQLGEIVSSKVLHDCEETREILGVNGEKYKIEYLNMRA